MTHHLETRKPDTQILGAYLKIPPIFFVTTAQGRLDSGQNYIIGRLFLNSCWNPAYKINFTLDYEQCLMSFFYDNFMQIEWGNIFLKQNLKRKLRQIRLLIFWEVKLEFMLINFFILILVLIDVIFFLLLAWFGGNGLENANGLE